MISLRPLEGGNHIVVWMWLLFLSNIAQSEASWKTKMQCRFNVGFGVCGYCKARTNQRQSSLKQVRSHIVYWMWLVVIFHIISHIIQIEATFCLTFEEKRHCGLDVAAVTIVTNLYDPQNPDYLLLWLQSALCGSCRLFKPPIIRIEVTFNPHFITREHLKTKKCLFFIWLTSLSIYKLSI